MTAAPAPRWRSPLAFAATTLIWGSTWLAIKGQLGAVPADWSVVWRFLLAAAGMFALAAWNREPLLLPRAAAPSAVAIGLLQFCANYLLVYRAEENLTSGLVAVIFAVQLVPNALLARVFLGTRVGARFVAGSLVALGGIALLLLNEARGAAIGGSVLAGVGFALGALSVASIANILQASQTVRSHPLFVQIAWAMLIGAAIDAALAWVLDGPPQFEWSVGYGGGVLFLALVGSVAAFPLYYGLIRDWGPGRAAYTGVAIPVVAMALSTLFEGYRWTALAVGGSALAIAGLSIALTARQQRG